MEESANTDVKRIPFLSKLPLIGNFFKKVDKNTEKNQMVIYLVPKIENPYNKLFAFGCLNSILAITKELQNVIISSNTTDNIHTAKVFAYNCGKFNVSNACLKLSRLNAFGIANGLDMISELDLNESKSKGRNCIVKRTNY